MASASTLQAMLDDDDPEVREWAAAALARHASSAAQPWRERGGGESVDSFGGHSYNFGAEEDYNAAFNSQVDDSETMSTTSPAAAAAAAAAAD